MSSAESRGQFEGAPRSVWHRRGTEVQSAWGGMVVGMQAPGASPQTRRRVHTLGWYTRLWDFQGPKASVWAPQGPWIPGQQTLF